MNALMAAKLFQKAQNSENVGDVTRQLLNTGVSDEDILKGMAMAAGYLPVPTVATAAA